MMWTEVQASDLAALEATGARLGIHPLALEDCAHRDQRPKLDDYHDHQLLVWFMVAGGRLYELQFVIFASELVVVPLDRPPQGNTWGEYLGLPSETHDVWHLLYLALDRCTDITWRDLHPLFESIDRFEEGLYDHATGFNEADSEPRELLAIKKRLNRLSVTLGPLGSVAFQLTSLCKPQDDLRWKLRDLRDHCERIARTTEMYRTQISAVLELYWGLEANRTNAQIKKLTLLAGLAIPLTFWASFWGMNFKEIPYESTPFFYFAMGGMILSALVTKWLFVRKGYWS
jgi:magnesium transporter